MTIKHNHWDIFCTVIDNYGDIGVTWRLAKQLASEYQRSIKLWVDDLNSFHHILPGLDPTTERQKFNNIEVIHWNDKTPASWLAGDTIIEAFACELPDAVKNKLEKCGKQVPVWLNLEYLSAESWIDDIHGLPSLQNNGISKSFFFPGFSEKSGGLICESDLFKLQDTFLSTVDVKKQFLAPFGIHYHDQQIISVFSYESLALETIVQSLVTSEKSTILLVPNSRSVHSISSALAIDEKTLIVGKSYPFGSLTLVITPFTDQEGFDKLLWLSDINIIRGEDSFLRAQWARKPFIWHIYPQDDQAHINKLNAFLKRYCEHLPTELAEIQKQVNLDFNLDKFETIIESWSSFNTNHSALLEHAYEWPKTALNGSDLASRLVDFVENRTAKQIKSQP
ncbi:elongation factor P maturation arginine rhamnosyltransferase EarP [Shewanella sp. 202IG2-18]|uniref:elongation factor P maturation arginine rhamnosyltransferase EarP n=1 Tax=Parashewanella hymeniacidonis TaxID=2807618 RepID=UPI001960E7CA|nr:elongation factor P maturation arginine rhamnosyltransferase EarP [Parashewanella hymeniacidonis]MBM7072635.1 elongation factor P maturation arginine rhamnosyltransferase EarP [Parashewanella hymeniacidonis]